MIYLFWGEGCPYCHAEQNFLTALKTQYPQIVVREFEVYHSEENRQYMRQMLAEFGLEPSGVPATFIGDRHWIGFGESVARQIEHTVITCSQNTCIDPGAGFIPVDDQTQQMNAAAPAVPSVENTLTLPLVGEVNLNGLSLGVSTALIALVDGFNPCSLWVLSILLGLVIHSGSRRKIMIIGLTFLTVTSAVYILFIVGLFSIFSFVSLLGWIQIAVALLALAFALINIKDYFWYKQGVSLTIADEHKPNIYRDMRGLLTGDKSTPALIAATAAMALGVTLIELPCTSGLPLLWTNIIAAHDVGALSFALLLGLYMLVFLVDELIIFGSAVFTLKATKLDEKQGRLLKLVGGMVMLVLALVLQVDPGIMTSFTSSLLVFGAAFVAAFGVAVLHRSILPRYGIHIGTEPLTAKRPQRARSHR